jgi:N-acetylmuramoyl-L-alanine amidase
MKLIYRLVPKLLSILVFNLVFLPIPLESASAKATHKSARVAKKAPAKKPLPIKPIVEKKPLIMLDPGHGAFDQGAKSFGCEEKNLCLLTALHLKDILIDRGYRIEMTRTQDAFVSLEKRTEIANMSRCELFVSVHYNAARSQDASGIEVFYTEGSGGSRSAHSKRLAHSVLNRLVQETGAKSRGVKVGNFHVIRETKMPAILVEGGFMTHPVEGKLLTSLEYIHQIAEGIAEGVDRYVKGIHHR